jgi:hypothetical protein
MPSPQAVMREVRKVQPGWFVRSLDGEWAEVSMIMTTNRGRKNLVFVDGEQSGYLLPGETIPTLGVREAKRAGLRSGTTSTS